jgi:hypothetical protein
VAALVQLLKLLTDVRRAAFHNLVACLFVIFIQSVFLLSLCNVDFELVTFLLLLLFLKGLFPCHLLLQLETHQLSLHGQFLFPVLLLCIMIVKILQNNFIPLSLSHPVPLHIFLLAENSTLLRVLRLRFMMRLDGYVTFDWLSIFYLGFSDATSRTDRAADGFVESCKLILTYVGNFQDQMIHFILNQIVEVFLRARVDSILVAKLVDQKLSELLAFCLLFIFLGLGLGPRLLWVHLWRAVISYLNRCGS